MRGAAAWDPEPALRRHLGALVGDRSASGSGEGLRRAEEYARHVFAEAGLAVWDDPIGPARGAWRNVIGDLHAGGPPGASRRSPATADLGAGPSKRSGEEHPNPTSEGGRRTDDGARRADPEPGSRPPLFVVGGHIDAVEGSPGADDNASGAAALLALAERFGAAPPEDRHVTLRFAAFNVEEWGMLGSQHHADALHAEERPVEGMISLEMLGYADPEARQRYPIGLGIGRRRRADFISVVGNASSRGLSRAVAASLGSVDGLPVETVTLPRPMAFLIGAALSDHASFWRHGVPAVMVGDTEFYRNPHYHLPSDRLETLDLPFLTKVTRGLALFLEEVCVSGRHGSSSWGRPGGDSHRARPAPSRRPV